MKEVFAAGGAMSFPKNDKGDQAVEARYRELLEQLNFQKAYELIERTMSEREDVERGFEILKYMQFWMDRGREAMAIKSFLHRGRRLKRFWAEFEDFLSKNGVKNTFEDVALIKKALFSTVNENYLQYHQQSDGEDTDVLMEVGKNFVELGDLDKAKETFFYLYSYNRYNSKILSYLGDTLLEMGDREGGLLFFLGGFRLSSAGY